MNFVSKYCKWQENLSRSVIKSKTIWHGHISLMLKRRVKTSHASKSLILFHLQFLHRKLLKKPKNFMSSFWKSDINMGEGGLQLLSFIVRYTCYMMNTVNKLLIHSHIQGNTYGFCNIKIKP